MINKHTFNNLLQTVLKLEEGICSLESVFCINMEENWLTNTNVSILNTMCEGFIDDLDTNNGQYDDILECLCSLIYTVVYDKPDTVYSVVIETSKNESLAKNCHGHRDLYDVMTWCVENNATHVFINRIELNESENINKN